MYAIISTGGKQLKVTNDEVVAVERLAGNAGDKVTFDQTSQRLSSAQRPQTGTHQSQNPFRGVICHAL